VVPAAAPGLHARLRGMGRGRVAFRALVENARRQEQVFVHRDYHSRNLLVGAPGRARHPRFPGRRARPAHLRPGLAAARLLHRLARERVYAWVEDYRQRLVEAGPHPRRRRAPSAAAST
jgi:hypothetical protein